MSLECAIDVSAHVSTTSYFQKTGEAMFMQNLNLIASVLCEKRIIIIIISTIVTTVILTSSLYCSSL